MGHSYMQLDLDQLRDLLAAFEQTTITELILKGNDFELTMRRGGQTLVVEPSAALMSSMANVPSVPTAPPPPMPRPLPLLHL
jgi:acetyl-CoA carboxylase biotin carboxyl carrier protein